MIYFDNSATTYPKPQTVTAAVSNAVKQSSNPGRSGHSLSLGAAGKIFSARQTVSDFFGMENEQNVIFTGNCTTSLNMAIKGILKSGDHAVVSSLEHNAVMRPLEKLKGIGVTYTKAEVYPCDNDKTLDSFRHAINSKTKAVICTHASNVWGIRLPIERLCALAHAYGLVMIVDAAQSAGILPVDMHNGFDIVCTAGHKGLYGPMGTGLMLLSEQIMPDTIIEGGTGSNSISLVQPEEFPDRFESGTPNFPGIMGLKAGISFVSAKGYDRIAEHEFRMIRYLYEKFQRMSKIILYTPEPEKEYYVPVLSFNCKGYASEEVAEILNKNGIAVRAGLHCAPTAHEAMGTLKTGAVRISPSVFNKPADMDRLLFVLSKT